MSIQDYIFSTRSNFPDKIKHELYDTVYLPYLELLFISSKCEMELIVTYSSTRKVECVDFNGASFLIYDQYMGQTLNYITRIILEDTRKFGAISYLFKYISERFTSFGLVDEAYKFAIGHSGLRNQLFNKNRAKTPIATDYRLRITAFQEFYLMAHEAYHRIFKEHPKLKEDVLKDVNNYLSFASSAHKNSTRKLIDAAKNSSDFYEKVPSDMSELLRNVKEGDPTLNYLEDTYNQNFEESFLEEMACDKMALMFLVTISLTGGLKTSIKDALTAGYMAHQTTKLLTLLDHAIISYSNETFVSEETLSLFENKAFKLAQVRKGYIHHSICMLQSQNSNSKYYETLEFLNSLDNKIHDQFGSITTKLSGSIGRGKLDDIPITDVDYKQKLESEGIKGNFSKDEIVKILTGWS